jgi:hypothetical protein
MLNTHNSGEASVILGSSPATKHPCSSGAPTPSNRKRRSVYSRQLRSRLLRGRRCIQHEHAVFFLDKNIADKETSAFETKTLEPDRFVQRGCRQLRRRHCQRDLPENRKILLSRPSGDPRTPRAQNYAALTRATDRRSRPVTSPAAPRQIPQTHSAIPAGR